MTDITENYSNQKTSAKRRQKKLNLRIDMTPMVDLGFLLISFFIFTTQMTKPSATNLFMPHDGDFMPLPESKSMTIIIGNKSDLYYYFGTEEVAIKQQLIIQSGYSESEIGNLIRAKQKALGSTKDDLMIVIKAGNNSDYKNLVDMLDEMLVNRVKHYSITDLSIQEEAFLSTR